ncbi:hypothetical protein DQ04_05141010 [Trypanosoma grayi]|uniref:hypothetical protein n=1 Tax=Trypanosoma grayi TaxID=71804 RepID=UPI0004F4A846|nr:hypothetical protein DQ04_05141010 [Trypanosoma grayi]KEG09482.1 hypothetical protein DQ04_05141010 [Trypanosoma grayi]
MMPGGNSAVRDIVHTLALGGVRNDASPASPDKLAATAIARAAGGRHNDDRQLGRNSEAASAMDASRLLLEVETLLRQSAFSERDRSTPAGAPWNRRFESSAQPPLSTTRAAAEEEALLPAADAKVAPTALANTGGRSSTARGGSGMLEVPPPDAFSAQWWRFREGYQRELAQHVQHEPLRRQEGGVNHIIPPPQTQRELEEAEAPHCVTDRSGSSGGGERRVEVSHAAPGATFTAPSATTSLVYEQPLQAPFSSAATMPVDNARGSYDAEEIHDTILCLKEARRLRRVRLASHDRRHSVPPPAPLSFCQRLDIPRSVHHDTAEALEEAMRLLLQERKWVTMRCTVLYDRLQQLTHHYETMVNRLKAVYGDRPLQLAAEA